MERSVLRLASRLNASYLAEYRLYLEACDSYRADGYRPHYCEHGTNMWTDYDNICGPCEDGLSMGDPMFRMAYAIDEAKRRDQACRDIAAAAATLRDLGVDIDFGPIWKKVGDILAV